MQTAASSVNQPLGNTPKETKGEKDDLLLRKSSASGSKQRERELQCDKIWRRFATLAMF